jgi:mannose-1-phosphate guanylyltransferase
LTTNAAGMAVPKQFCSLRGGDSLLRDAMKRAEAVARRQHICLIVAEQHRTWWTPALEDVDRSNLIVQPRNCGTANGILLPLLHIVRRDPEARIVLLPSDHHVDNERVLADALRRATRLLQAMSRQILLLGFSPEQADPELGYIVPGDQVGRSLSTVRRFVEKPSTARARRLIKSGALWNSFIMAARAGALLALFQARIPRAFKDLQEAVARDCAHPYDPAATSGCYQHLADVDFSRSVLAGGPLRLERPWNTDTARRNAAAPAAATQAAAGVGESFGGILESFAATCAAAVREERHSGRMIRQQRGNGAPMGPVDRQIRQGRDRFPAGGSAL